LYERPLVYLACPYSHDSDEVVDARAAVATVIAGRLTRDAGLSVFSPITHSHEMVRECERMPNDWDFWETIDRDYLRVSHQILVVDLPGWEQSVGVTAEREYADLQGIPTTLLDPTEYIDDDDDRFYPAFNPTDYE